MATECINIDFEGLEHTYCFEMWCLWLFYSSGFLGNSTHPLLPEKHATSILSCLLIPESELPFFFFFFLGKHLNLLNKGYSKEIQSRKVLPWNSLLPSFFSWNQGLIPAHWQCGCPKRGNLSFVWLYGCKLNPVNVLLGLAIRLCSFQTTAVMCFPTRKKAAVFCLIVISKISVALFSNLV